MNQTNIGTAMDVALNATNVTKSRSQSADVNAEATVLLLNSVWFSLFAVVFIVSIVGNGMVLVLILSKYSTPEEGIRSARCENVSSRESNCRS